MLSEDYSAEFKQRFAGRYADGATITMLQHEFGLAKSTVKLWRERIDQGGVGAIDRPRKNNRYPQDFKLRVVEAYLRSEGGYEALAPSVGPPDSLLLPFGKRGPLHFWGLAHRTLPCFLWLDSAFLHVRAYQRLM